MKKWIPLIVILFLMIIAFFVGLPHYFTFEKIKENREMILSMIEKHPILMPSLFILLYIVVVSLSLPGASILTITGGFFFGIPFGTIYVIIGATIGATIIFLAARSALGNFLREKSGPFLQKMEAGFKKNAASYLLSLRFLPLFPFWLVNIAPAFFNVRTWTYVWTTGVGIIPGSYVYSQAGRGLGAIFESGESFSFQSVFNVQMQFAVVCLALFSLIPVFVKRYKKNDR
ncbi:MAG: TVP38/TMEM64 family protein [Chlamydiia bacterium]|nr:TVP38/TMEM64 family protein [Chlamydiia bacterium]